MKKNSTFFSGDYLLWRSCLQKEKQKNPQGNEKISELTLLQDKASLGSHHRRSDGLCRYQHSTQTSATLPHQGDG